jgi:hypothetical protein
VLDPGGVELAVGEGSGPILGAGSDQRMIAWSTNQVFTEFGMIGDTRAARLGPALELLDPGGFLVDTDHFRRRSQQWVPTS